MKLKNQTVNTLPCILPWKALCMDHFDGILRALPCCSECISINYGEIKKDTTIDQLWNSSGAQEIRYLLSTGKSKKICSPDCHWLHSERFNESNLQVLEGPVEFVNNQKLNNEEIRDRKLVLESYPIALRLIPTLLCNNNCRMCYQDHKIDLRIPDLFYNSCLNLFPYLYDYQIQGGEVLISNLFPNWVSPEIFHSNSQLRLSLITNGTYIPPQVKEVLKQVRINYIKVSVNAASRQTYKLISGFDRFNNVLENIIFLRDIGCTHAVSNFIVSIGFVIMRSNYQELQDFVNLANQLGVSFHLILMIGNINGESFYNDPFIINDLLNILEKIKSAANENSLQEIDRIIIALKRISIN